LQILSKLCAAELVSEEIRQATVKKIINLSEREHSCRFADSPCAKGLFTDEEEKAAVETITTNLLLEGANIVEEIKDNWDKESDPEDLFSEIDRTLTFIQWDERFDEDSQSNAASLREEIKRLVRELEGQIEEPTYDELDTEQAIETATPSGRSVFDDVDQ